MEWYWMLIIIFGVLTVIMLMGMPVAFAFIISNLILAYFLLGKGAGIEQVVLSFKSLGKFTLIPLPLFILMGEVIFQSGIAPKMMDALDAWLGRLPGRLGLVAVGGATLFSTMTGSTAASCAMLGSSLVPEMMKRGYSKSMSLGPIVGSGGLAMMIPPSGIAVLLGAIGEINIGEILIAIIPAGLLMAVLFAAYIIIRCWLQPSLAPAYDIPHISLATKLSLFARYILPVGFIIFLVVGIIFLGVATPTEAAATGAVGSVILAAAYKRLNWTMFKKSMFGTLKAAGMVMLIIGSAEAFSNILAFSRASSGLSNWATTLPVGPVWIIVGFLVVSILLGTFMGPSAVMMITLPIFVPIVRNLGFNDVWFAVLFLITIEMGESTPPYGMALFIMKAVGPTGTTMNDVYASGYPYLVMDLIAIALIILFPGIVLALPNLMTVS